MSYLGLFALWISVRGFGVLLQLMGVFRGSWWVYLGDNPTMFSDPRMYVRGFTVAKFV